MTIFKFDENGRKFSKWIENAAGKGEIARNEQFLLFPVFSKVLYCRHIKKSGFVWERVKSAVPINQLTFSSSERLLPVCPEKLLPASGFSRAKL